MKIAKTLTMMAVLSVACLAQAKKGDTTVKTFTEMTGNQVILEIGDCALLNKQEPVSGKMTTSVQLPYAVCSEVRSYEADVTDNGWFHKNTISNPRNVQMGVVSDVKTYENNNVGDVLMNQSSNGNVLIDALNNTLDAANLLRECQLKKQKLEMQARTNNPALAQACGAK